MNDYLRLTSGNVTINTPFEVVKHEIIKQSPVYIHYKTTYSNGLELEFSQTPNEIVLTTNGKNMTLNSNGSVDIEV